MEDILALIVVTLAVAIMAYVVYRFVKKNKQAEKEYQERQARLDERLAKMRQETTRKLIAEDAKRVELRRHPNYGMPEFDPKNPDVLKPRETVVQQKNRFREEVSTPAPVNNWSTDLLTTMVITDLLSTHSTASAGTVTETYSKSSSSFGMDDDDSRKSVASSFSSSDSWSDSSSSSSDSGPSSDW